MKTTTQKLLALSIAFSLTGATLTACDNEVKGPKADTTEVPAATAPATDNAEAPAADEKKDDAAAPAAELKAVEVNKETSKIEFVGAKVTGKHEGGFKDFSGKLMVDDKSAVQGVQFTVKTASVFSDDEKLTGHLMSPDFFDVEKMPEATFESTSIKEGSDVKGEGDKTYSHTITGNLALHGVTKQITFPANIDTSGDKITASADFVIDRFDFNIKYPGMKDDLIKQEVKLMINLEAPKPAM